MSYINELTFAVVNRSMDMCDWASNGNFPPGGLIYSYTDNKLYYPNHFVFNDTDILYVITRSTSSSVDWQTDFDLEEVNATFGNRTIKAHRGFYYSATHIYQNTKEYIKNFTGKKIIFTGTSLGGSVSAVLCHIANTDPDMEGKEIIAIGSASAPCMEYVPPQIQEKTLLFVNQDDIITTVSIPNIYDTYRDSIEINNFQNQLLDDINQINSTSSLFNAVKNLVKQYINVVNALVMKYHNDKNAIKVRYLWGKIMHLKVNSTNCFFNQTLVNTTSINRLNLWGTAFEDHSLSQYRTKVNKLEFCQNDDNDDDSKDKSCGNMIKRKSLYLVVGTMGFVIICLLLILIVVIVCKRKKNLATYEVHLASDGNSLI